MKFPLTQISELRLSVILMEKGESAGVGIALWLPDGTILGGYTREPSVIRRMWSRHKSLYDVKDIFQIEAVGPLLILYN